jgi:dihydroorotate dehydrogenase (fumarate)
MTDLSTNYLGFDLKNPLIASASPLSAYVDNIKRMENAGIAAVVLPSLFEEQIEREESGANQFPELHNVLPDALKHIPRMREYNLGANGYLSLVYQAKQAANIPIIASLNGYYSGGWVKYARLIESAGADALELNIYYLAAQPHISGADIEQMYIHLVQSVKAEVKIPVAVKISPFFSALAHMATQLDEAGADGLVLFNRFYQPDFDLEEQTIVPNLDLSRPSELRLRLRWAAILADHVKADIAVTGGVHQATDVVKAMMAGAKVVMVASVLLGRGIEHIGHILTDLETWLQDHNYDSIEAIQGKMSQQSVADPAALERANYMNVLKSLEG